MRDSRPFFIDWERLEKSEVENLCRELLSQMGFRRLEWGKMAPEVDLVAELPRKDPYGFEYRELWLISMGLRDVVRHVQGKFVMDKNRYNQIRSILMATPLSYCNLRERSSEVGVDELDEIIAHLILDGWVSHTAAGTLYSRVPDAPP